MSMALLNWPSTHAIEGRRCCFGIVITLQDVFLKLLIVVQGFELLDLLV